MAGSYIFFNGRQIPSGNPIISAQSRGLKYGDGIFETMRLTGVHLVNKSLHFERLFHGVAALKLLLPETFTIENILSQIERLVSLNELAGDVRVRLSVFRGNGFLLDNEIPMSDYLLETTGIPPPSFDPENNLEIGIVPGVIKSVDDLSALKSNNYLPYSMAAMYAREKSWAEAILLNSSGRICEGNVSNIFIVKGEEVYTPHPTEGCVAGVMRRFLLERIVNAGVNITERPIEIDQLQEADEIFLSNAISYIKPVGIFGEKKYQFRVSREIYNTVLKTIEKDIC